MGLLETSIIYGLVGLAVAAALVLREDQGGVARRAVTFVSGVAFWPVFAPVLFAGRARQPPSRRATFRGRIEDAQAQLLEALGRVQGMAEMVAPEVARVRGLAGSLEAMEERLGEMDEMLATPEFDTGVAQAALTDLARRGIADDDPRVQSVRSRLKNIERLKAMRERTCEDLERIVLKIEEMISRLQLLKFAGRPDAEVVQLFKEIADSVEEVSEGILAAS
jgi:hypothetical protein